ncbi:PREDICTED: uncharacterized protein LOC106806559 [Priapulus caudatus]|uniref:Uncharacterized protein LOC106806559 n=1 Tax=Priapulus caudatus TaxID=37621 RepID=A0ABM1DVR3_PRICU|nr:PREDICTED: uncharacterized protein LOC106806559 [Priapulus caudatus]
MAATMYCGLDLQCFDANDETLNNDEEHIEPKEKRRRFKPVDEVNVSDLVKRKDSQNTQNVIKNAVSVLRDFCKETAKTLPENIVEVTELCSVLQEFFLCARKKNSEEYKCNGLIGIRYGLQRYFQCKRKWDIIDDGEFKDANVVFKAKIKDLKRIGKGVYHHPAITEEDLQKLYHSSCMSANTPSGLQTKVQFDIQLYLCRSGRENLSKMTVDHFAISTDASGRRFVYQQVGKLAKNHKTADGARSEGRMYEIRGDLLCPVASFEKLLSKLNPYLNRLWQKPMKANSVTELSPMWFHNLCLGKNSLGILMKRISEEAKLSVVYTNDSIRATSVIYLDQKVFKDRQIMSVGVHRSETNTQASAGDAPTADDEEEMSDGLESLENSCSVLSPSTERQIRTPLLAAVILQPAATAAAERRSTGDAPTSSANAVVVREEDRHRLTRARSVGNATMRVVMPRCTHNAPPSAARSPPPPPPPPYTELMALVVPGEIRGMSDDVLRRAVAYHRRVHAQVELTSWLLEEEKERRWQAQDDR